MSENRKSLKIFLSHAWEDINAAKLVEESLRNVGVNVWVDYSNLKIGENIPKEISSALDNCDMVLLIWSKSARKSKWVELEWTSAITLEKNVIPCLIDNSKLPSLLSNKNFFRINVKNYDPQNLLKSLSLSLKDNNFVVTKSWHNKYNWKIAIMISIIVVLCIIIFLKFKVVNRVDSLAMDDTTFSKVVEAGADEIFQTSDMIEKDSVLENRENEGKIDQKTRNSVQLGSNHDLDKLLVIDISREIYNAEIYIDNKLSGKSPLSKIYVAKGIREIAIVYKNKSGQLCEYSVEANVTSDTTYFFIRENMFRLK